MESWILFALLSAFFASLVAILGKVGISGVDTMLATTIRAAIMAALLILVTSATGKINLIGTLNNKALLFIFFSGIAGALSWAFYFFALKFGPASSVSAIDRLSIVFVVFLAAIFLGEGLTFRSILGTLLIILGAVFLTFK